MPDSGDSSDRLVLGALAAFAGAVTTVWAGAVVAAVATGHGIPHAITLSDAAQAAVRLPSHASNPALAWPPAVARSLPGPVLLDGNRRSCGRRRSGSDGGGPVLAAVE